MMIMKDSLIFSMSFMVLLYAKNVLHKTSQCKYKKKKKYQKNRISRKFVVICKIKNKNKVSKFFPINLFFPKIDCTCCIVISAIK